MYKGVTKTEDGRYEAKVFSAVGESRIGVYDSAIDAAIAYDLTVEATLGELGEPVMNFPELSRLETPKRA